jgi:hypothetical protein
MITEVSAIDLLKNRNRALGWLLTSERAVPYIEILLCLQKFRDNHELEPLHDDLLAAQIWGKAQTTDGQTPFNQDMRQLLDWNLVTERIEKERLRGYKDTRRRKFRYKIADDAVSFLVWLESRYQDDLQPEDTDTRDLLADMISSLRETSRMINKISSESAEYEEVRAIFHRLAKMAATTDGVAESLGDFNIRLLSFVGGTYQIAKAHQLIRELDRFLEKFLRRIHTLRVEIGPEIEKLRLQRLASRWELGLKIMAEESATTQSIMRTRILNPEQTLSNLAEFYGRDGQLERLAARINKSAMLVWQKLHAHLRELERRSHRLEDVRGRILDLSGLDDRGVPHQWLRDVLQPATMIGDMHDWTETIKADPPQPVWSKHRVRSEFKSWIETRPMADGKPMQSMDERRLEVLSTWMHEHGIMPDDVRGRILLSTGKYTEFADFTHIMDVVRSGVLGDGRRLAKIGALADITDSPTVVATDESELSFSDILLRKADKP